MKIYRMHHHSRMTADYTGAMLAGGRWNSIGTPMLYAAQNLSLACLEVLVHLDKRQLPQEYVWSEADLKQEPSPLQFSRIEEVSSCQLAGQSWIRAATSLAAQVPSVIIPREFNILLNPNRSEYANLRWSNPQPFRFDPRLFTSEPQVL
ncbi:MAG: RES family NAD+ phosphorylase [Candidatus Korobacteraceae bacterium]